MSVSVGGGGAPPSPPPKKQQGFIISPRLDAFEAEMMILDNFNQIQQVLLHQSCSPIRCPNPHPNPNPNPTFTLTLLVTLI